MTARSATAAGGAGETAGLSGQANDGRGTGTNGGVTSLRSTSTHRACRSAGRRQTRPLAAASTARAVASRALLRPTCRSVSTGGPLSAALVPGRRLLFQVLEQAA